MQILGTLIVVILFTFGTMASNQLNPGGTPNELDLNLSQNKIAPEILLKGEEKSSIHHPSSIGLKANDNNDALQYTSSTKVEPESIHMMLEKLSPDEMKNARISIELSGNATSEMFQKIDQIENLWNNNNFDAAINNLTMFEEEYSNMIDGIGISWIKPRVIQNTEGIDVQIGPRANVFQMKTDFDVTNDHLLAVLDFEDGTTKGWTTNISTDGGATWLETYFWSASYRVSDVDAAVVAGYFYVGYIGGGTQDAARMRRFNTTDGAVDAGYSFVTIFDNNIRIRDVAVFSNTDNFNNRIYYTAIMADGTLPFYYADENGVTWTDFSTAVADADHGLDATWNTNNSANNYFYMSYVNSSGQLYSVYYNGSAWTTASLVYASTDTNHVTSVAAYQDTIMIVYEDTSSIKYRVSYDMGTSWLWGVIANGVDFHKPHITGRMGDGFGVLYLEEAGAFDPVWYRHRTYEFGTGFTDPYTLNDADCYSFGKTCIEWTPTSGQYEYAASWIGSGFSVFFDKVGDPTGINNEKPVVLQSHKLIQNFPNPFNPSTTIKYQLSDLKVQNTTLKIYNSVGQLVRTLVDENQGQGEYSIIWNGLDDSGRQVASGVYFYKLVHGDFLSTQKLVKLK